MLELFTRKNDPVKEVERMIDEQLKNLMTTSNRSSDDYAQTRAAFEENCQLVNLRRQVTPATEKKRFKLDIHPTVWVAIISAAGTIFGVCRLTKHGEDGEIVHREGFNFLGRK